MSDSPTLVRLVNDRNSRSKNVCVAVAAGADERPRPDHLAGDEDVGEAPGHDRERRAGGVELVGGDPVVVEEVADHPVGDVEVERRVQQRRGQHHPVLVRARPPRAMLNTTAGTPISAATQASAGVRRTAHSAISTTPVPIGPEERPADGAAVGERVGQHREQLRQQQDARRVPADGARAAPRPGGCRGRAWSGPGLGTVAHPRHPDG